MRFAKGGIVVQLQLRIISAAGRIQQTIQALRSLMVPAQLDRGCSGCWLYVDNMDSRCLCYVEEWATSGRPGARDLLARFTLLLSVMEEAPKAPSLEFRFISQTRGLDYVKEIRLVRDDDAASEN